MNWISVDERLPKRRDTGHFRNVLVLPRQSGDPVEDSYLFPPETVPFHMVRKTRHSHWAVIPAPPEDENDYQ